MCLTATCSPGATTSSETPLRPTSGSFFPSTQWHLEGPDTQQQKEHDKETPGYGLKKVNGQHATSSLGGENQVREGRAEAPARGACPSVPHAGPWSASLAASHHIGFLEPQKRGKLSPWLGPEKTHGHFVRRQTEQFNGGRGSGEGVRRPTRSVKRKASQSSGLCCFLLGVGFSENVHFKEPLRCFSEELRTQLAAGSERTPAPTQLLQPPKPWTDLQGSAGRGR